MNLNSNHGTKISSLPGLIYLVSVLVLLLSGCTGMTHQTPSGAATHCVAASLVPLPGLTITSVQAKMEPAPHCQITGEIEPAIGFKLLLPDSWNGKFVMGGGGGFVGTVVNWSLIYGSLQQGYATVGTDTGHQANSLDASWALNDLERIVAFGHQGVHRTASYSKSLIKGYYQQEIEQNYFVGCSRGGGQALMEAQRYPGDFNAIVAGAPAYNWTHELGARNTWVNQIMFPDPNNLAYATIGPDAELLIGNAVLDQCDSLDGLKDGILNNPLACRFDVSELACTDDSSDACLTDSEVRAAERIYNDLTDDSGIIYPGMPPGAESSPGGWMRWFTGGLDRIEDPNGRRARAPLPSDFPYPATPNAHFAFGNGVMKYLLFHDQDWDYSQYTLDSFRADAAPVASTLNATNPDLSAFLHHGGKLLIWSGWNDRALSPKGTIDYYEQVLKQNPSARKDVRLIMMPGVEHCLGGPGPSFVNYLDEIDRWATTGSAPEKVTAFWLDKENKPDGARPACAYPSQLKYNGSGHTRSPENFSCVAP